MEEKEKPYKSVLDFDLEDELRAIENNLNSLERVIGKKAINLERTEMETPKLETFKETWEKFREVLKDVRPKGPSARFWLTDGKGNLF